jgi:hypothetical protein
MILYMKIFLIYFKIPKYIIEVITEETDQEIETDQRIGIETEIEVIEIKIETKIKIEIEIKIKTKI